MITKYIKNIFLGLTLLTFNITKTEESYWQKFKDNLNKAKEWTVEKWENLIGKKEEMKPAKFECPRKDSSPSPEDTTAPEAKATAAPEKK